MGRCELCIREYYVGKLELLNELQTDYEEDEINSFFKIIDNRDTQRITDGLSRATTTLRSLSESRRKIGNLPRPSMFAVFEALSCEAFLRDDLLLRKHFDEPFRLLQPKKPLKTRDYVPAATRFLFDETESRVVWATFTWSQFNRPPTDLEWDWAIKDTLQSQLQMASTSKAIQLLWSGLTLIVKQLDQNQITYRLCDLVPNVCFMTLEHSSKKNHALQFVLETMEVILEKAPDAFWQAMGSISPSAVVERVFQSPDFQEYLEGRSPRQEIPAKDEKQGKSVTASEEHPDKFCWIIPFLMSLKPANRPAACRSLVGQLLKRARREELPGEIRYICYKAAMVTLLETLRGFTDSVDTRQSVERLVLRHTLETVTLSIQDVLHPEKFGTTETQRMEIKTTALDVLRNSLALDSLCLKADFEMLSVDDGLKHDISIFCHAIWEAVVEELKENNVQLSSAVLNGILALPGLEQFKAKNHIDLGKEKTTFNRVFETMTGLVSKILEKIAEFKPEHLDELFKTQDTSLSLVSALFSADMSTYQAAVDLLKNISGQAGRKEALAHLLQAFFGTTVYSFCWSLRRIANMRSFASVPRMLKTGMDVLDILCNSQTGMLRTCNLRDREPHAVKNYWTHQWQALKTVFQRTESWHSQGHEKALLMEVCRDAMQYGEALFEQYAVFAHALVDAMPSSANEIPKAMLEVKAGSPGSTIEVMIKWLRLRDVYLASTLVKLFTRMLRRLGENNISVNPQSLAYVQEVATTSSIKTILSNPEKAELARALEAYYGSPIKIPETLPSRPQEVKKQGTLREYFDPRSTSRTGSETPVSWAQSADELADSDAQDSDYYDLSNRSMDINKARVATIEREALKGAQQKAEALRHAPPSKARLHKLEPLKKKVQAETSAAFIAERRRVQELAEARKREGAAMIKGSRGVSEQTKGQGSGIDTIGVKGKDHATAQGGLMVSSESESESEDDLDRQLFGSKVETAKQTTPGQFAGMIKSGSQWPSHRPVKKTKQIRSQKDMRARLTPDLSALHTTILGWDFFTDSELPPNSAQNDYTLVTNIFKTALEYQRTFEPLLILEGWQAFRSAKEEGNFKPFEVKVSNRLSVDNFVEVSTTMSFADGKELGVSTADVVLLSKSKKAESDADQPHCFARVKEVSKKKGQYTIVYRVNASNNRLLSALVPGLQLWGVQILSLTPLEREFAALMALPYYDLSDEIIKAKPSPVLDYTEKELQPFVENFDVNFAQAKAVKSALDNDAFTLIQGPPGSGKTKTICALVGAMMTGSLTSQAAPSLRTNGSVGLRPLMKAAKKVLICAPSNAAVDELVMRFKAGVKSGNGTVEKLSVVRLGRSEAINSNVKDVTLEELVSARLNLGVPKQPDQKDIHDIMMEHKETSNQQNSLRIKMDEIRALGQPVKPEMESQFDGLKQRKSQLSLQIDDARDRQNTASRDAELSRKRVQQEILDSAHVLCATLSGSGHEIFHGLNIEFETVIIDEAAQSIELSALIPLKYGCSKCILVGDPKQLPPTVLSREAARFQYEQSLFARMERNHSNDVHLLDTQYRMHPEISSYPSRTFYDGRLKDGVGMAKLRARPWHQSPVLAPYRFFDVEGMSSSLVKGHSLINVAELEVAMQLYDRLITDCRHYDFRGKIGIITPYKGQLRELRVRFARRYGETILSDVEFNTTDSFQGRESEIIIFSCVRASSRGLGFLNDIRRMNVGLTRAKCSLWVLGNSQSLSQGAFWWGMIEDARRRSLYTDGDIMGLLSRRLLTEDMMKGDVQMGGMEVELPIPSSTAGTQMTSSAKLPPSDRSWSGVLGRAAPENTLVFSRPDSALSRTSSWSSINTNVTKTSPSYASGLNSSSNAIAATKPDVKLDLEEQTPTVGPRGPSGGRFGLNDHALCGTCGSGTHFSRNCNNDAARAAALGLCFRCRLPGHGRHECSAPRCLECGQVGHRADDCVTPLASRLGAEEKMRVRRQEVEFGRDKDRARGRRAEMRLGEHGAKVPTVKSLLPFNGNLNGRALDGKRRRDDAPPPEAPKAPKALKAMRSSEDAARFRGQIKSSSSISRLHDTTPDGLGGTHPDLDGGSAIPSVPVPSGVVVRPPLGVGGPLVRKKRPKEDDLFVKRK